jgi:hypothetical protein
MKRHLHCVAATALLFVMGCRSDPRPTLVPISGQVFVDNRPATNAVVWLHPIEPSEFGTRRPHGTVDREGNFDITTYIPKDGAPAGRYRVSIYWRTPTTSGDEDGESLIPYRYMDPATSDLPVVEVEQDPVILAPFHLTTN